MLILLVEDSKTIALALRRKFETMGHEVAMAEDGQAAVDWFASGHPDLVVMDIEMPRMNGFEAARRIREMEFGRSGPEAWTPIVFLTATDTVQNLLAAIGAGGDDFLPKSAPIEVLEAKLGVMERILKLMARLKSLSEENVDLVSLASTDSMTKLPNRRELDARLLAMESERARDGFRPLAVLMVDVDHFKAYNDTLGHGAGDVCLARIGGALLGAAAEAGPRAFSARYGGEEFIMAIDGAEQAAAMRAAWALCARIEQLRIEHPANDDRGWVSVSVGVACLVPGRSVKEMLKRADQALYEAKAGGRARAEWRKA